MKKYIFLLFIFCLQLVPSKAQWVTIPDANFVAYLQTHYPSCMNGNLMDTTCSFVINLDSLEISYTAITDLTGIEYFESLTYLGCIGNVYLTNIPVFPNSIQSLNCSENYILNSLSDLPDNLTSLKCNNNQLASLPNLPSTLEYLDCQSNQLTSLPNLPSNLQWLYCQINQLTSLPQVPDSMEFFFISYNNISCVNNLPVVLLDSILPGFFADIAGNPLTCVPNQTSYSLGLPLCIDNDPINNPNNCISYVNISGYVFTDQNSNCSFNTGDWGSNNVLVNLFDNQNNLLSQCYSSNGIYGFSISQPGNYKVKLEYNNLPIAMACAQADSQLVNLVSTSNNTSNINFSVQCNEAYDVYPQSVSTQGWVFPGQTHSLNANISSNEAWFNLDCGSSNYSGTVSINITGPVSYVAPSLNSLIPTVNGNTYTYNISDFNTITPNSFGLQFLTDTTAQAGDQICVHIEINPTPIDADTANNSYDFCYQVLNSYDPNMKEVYPINVLPGYDDWFTYTIHFQNTGNAPAFNIRLRDTLDTNLDINTFEVRGYSHPAIVSINGNILTVRFNNIMLQDSTTDYEGSMGYFQYRIKPLPNLPLGSQIENTAYIYFDYNAPIVTNTTQNNFQLVTDVKSNFANQNNFVIYPNPSTGIYFFKDSRNVQNIEVFNIMGELILSQGNANQINLQAFPKGIYVARINGAYVKRLVKE